eukprot:Em0023g592a
MPSRNRKKRYLQKQDDILSQENKAKARARYKADPEKKKASVRDSYKADPEKKKASVRDSYKVDPEKKKASVRDSYKADPEKKKASVRDSYNADIESKQSAKRQRYQEDLEENRAAKRQRYQEDVEENRAAKRQRYQEDLEENRAAKRQRYQDDVDENRAAKRQKYEDNSAAIKASERNRYWNDPAVRLAKRAAERKRYRRGYRTTTTTQRSAICAIFDDEDCQLDTPRMKLAKEAAKVILDSSADCHHDGQDKFENFADKIVGTYQKLVPDPAIPKSKKAFDNKKRHLWSKFHSARISELRVLWKEYFQSSALDVKYLEDPLLCEYVNEKLFGMFVKTMYEVNEQQIVVADPTENDLNALRYAAGYVPWKLLQKYSKPTCTDPNRQDFIVCLSSLSQKGEGSVTSTYLEYTKRWLLAIDRGGLFHIHDEAYNPLVMQSCGCAYDGVEPGVALAQSSGQRGPKRLSTGSEQREAAKRARIEIAKATELEERTIGTEPTIKQVETVHDLWQAFEWSQATKKKLPNEDLRKGDVLLKESGGSGWSTMVQSVLAAVVRCAEILYPANSDSLLEEVAARLSQSSSTKDENLIKIKRVTGRAYLEPYKKDIKRMFERGARVSSDKMSPCAVRGASVTLSWSLHLTWGE